MAEAQLSCSASEGLIAKPHEVQYTANGFADLRAKLNALGGEARIVMERTVRYLQALVLIRFIMEKLR